MSKHFYFSVRKIQVEHKFGTMQWLLNLAGIMFLSLLCVDWSCRLTLVSEPKLTCIFNMQYNGFLISVCSLAFSQGWKYLQDVQRSSEILEGLQK